MSGRRKLLLVAGSLLAVVVGSCSIFVGAQPGSFAIMRATTVRAAPERVHGVVVDVRAFDAWAPWPPRPGVTRSATFSETTTGVGAWVQWSSSDGTSRMTIVSDSPSEVRYRDDLDGRVSASRQTFHIGRTSSATTLAWTFAGDNDLLRRVLWPVARLEQRLGPDMEASLRRLAAMLDAQ